MKSRINFHFCFSEWTKVALIVLFFLVIASPTGISQAGSLDLGFGQEGIARTNVGYDNDRGYCTLIQPDGKILVAGKGGSEFALARYQTDGSLDNTFGDGGKVFTAFTFMSEIRAMALQQDGKIVAGGNFESTLGGIVRYNPDGSLDETFGEGGINWFYDIWWEVVIYSIAIQEDGKIVLAGYLDKWPYDDFLIARLLPDGSFDNSFGDNGIANNGSFQAEDSEAVISVSIQSDGKILAGGYLYNGLSLKYDFLLMRFMPDGSPDSSFGVAGVSTTDIGHGDLIISLQVQSDGKIVAGGTSWIPNGSTTFTAYDFALARYNADGSLDEGFGNGGIFIWDFSEGEDLIESIIIQPDGKIVVGGYVENATDLDLALMRFTPDGSLDNTFGEAGIVIEPIGPGNDVITEIGLQPDGKIVAGGYTVVGIHEDFLLTRFEEDGSPDPTLGNGGVVITSVTHGNNNVASLALQEDGHILANGGFHIGSKSFLSLVRFTSNGAEDMAFGVDGRVIMDVFPENFYAYPTSMLLQTDGKLLFAGFGNDLNSSGSYLVRSTKDGTLDTSFGVNGVLLDTNEFYVPSLALQPDGKILMGGPKGGDFALVRYHQDGQIDTDFGTNGIVITNISLSNDQDDLRVLIVQPDGKIVAGGSSYYVNSRRFALARYNSDGSLDNTFSGDGKTSLLFVSGGDSYLSDLILQADGKLVAGGFTITTDGRILSLARWNPDGTLDTSFGLDGKVTTTIEPAYYSNLSSLAIQSDGKILAGGSSSPTIFDEVHNYTLIRYNTDGSLDSTFGNNGIVISDVGDGGIRKIAIQTDGKIVAAGSVDGDFVLVRYLSGLEVGVLDFSGSQNTLFVYPNPIEREATLGYILLNDATLSIDLYDINGRLVQSLVEQEKRPAGEHKEVLNLGSSIVPGSYILVLSNGLGRLSLQIVKQ